jgi:hypothetical protein
MLNDVEAFALAKRDAVGLVFDPSYRQSPTARKLEQQTMSCT